MFRRIHVVDNALVIARARRANMRYVYKFSLPGMSPKDRQSTIDDIKKRHTTKKFIDRDTGQIRTEEAPMRVEDDIFISKDDDVTALSGDTNITNIADVEHLYNQLFTAIGVPKSFLNREQDVNSKATLTELRIQFSRNVKRIQSALASGLRKFYQIGLLAKGITDDQVERLKFDVKFPSVTATDELIEWQTKQAKAGTFQSLSTMGALSADKLEDVNTVRKEVFPGLEEIEAADFIKFRQKAMIGQAIQSAPTLLAPVIGDILGIDIPQPAANPNQFGGNPFQPRQIDPAAPKMPVEVESIIRHLSDNPEQMDVFEDLKMLIDENLAALQKRPGQKLVRPRPLPIARSSTGKGR